MHSSKGLEFPLVCIPATGMPHKHDEADEDEARLMLLQAPNRVPQLCGVRDRAGIAGCGHAAGAGVTQRGPGVEPDQI